MTLALSGLTAALVHEAGVLAGVRATWPGLHGCPGSGAAAARSIAAHASGEAAILAVLLAAAIATILYWLLAVSEGAYLGPRVVGWLYDRGAPTYDAVKRFVAHDEASHLANPLVERLESDVGTAARVLDVATGTGRLAQSLLGLPHFAGSVVGVDLSAGMLAEAGRKLSRLGERSVLVRAAACPLPFADASFDAVVLLEALEFLPDREATIREVARVLVPGGVALVSNRIGVDRWLLLGRVDSGRDLTRRLERAGLENVRRCRWQTYYDLYWCRKTGSAAVRRDQPDAWRDVLRCPTCATSGAWAWSSTGAVCGSCGRRIEQRSGYWDLTAG